MSPSGATLRATAACLALAIVGCPEAQLAVPTPPGVPATVTEWISCAQELGFHPERVEADSAGVVRAVLHPPTRGALAASNGEDPVKALLAWHTPVPTGSWTLTLTTTTDGLVLQLLEPPRFIEAQRLVAVGARCGLPAAGPGLAEVFIRGESENAATRFAARLIAPQCVAENAPCPPGWRARLLELARQDRGDDRPRFEDRCADVAAPERVAGVSLAHTLREWVVDEVGAEEGATAGDWAVTLREAGLGTGESAVRARFEALLADGDPSAAARLIDEASVALTERKLGRLSERLRYDGARAWIEAGEPARARVVLQALSADGRTIYSDFARDDLRALGVD